MKKIILALFCLITVVVCIKQIRMPPATETPPSAPISAEQARELINKEDCLANINFLASDELEGRMSGKKGNELAAEYIREKMQSYGLKTIYQKFEISKVNPGPYKETGNSFTQNLYAWIEGSELKDEIVVVGAHFDHIGYGPRYSRSSKTEVHNGADDNASGTVSVLEVAKAISKLKPLRTIVFQLYSGEEMGLLGSKHYCDNPLFPIESPSIKKHIAMINLDMVGHLEQSPAKVKDFIFDLKEQVNRLSEKYSFANRIIGTGGGSDHVPFNNKGVPVLFIHTGTHRYYHTPEDDVSTLNVEGIVDICKFTFDLLWILANESSPKKAILYDLPFESDHDQNKF